MGGLGALVRERAARSPRRCRGCSRAFSAGARPDSRPKVPRVRARWPSSTLGAPTPQLLARAGRRAAAVVLIATRAHRPVSGVPPSGWPSSLPLALLAPAVNRIEPATMARSRTRRSWQAIRSTGARRVLMIDEPDAGTTRCPTSWRRRGWPASTCSAPWTWPRATSCVATWSTGPMPSELRQLAGVDLVVKFGDAACPGGGGEKVPVGFPPAPWMTAVAGMCLTAGPERPARLDSRSAPSAAWRTAARRSARPRPKLDRRRGERGGHRRPR